MLAEFALQPGHLSEGNVVREEIQQAVVLNPVLLRVTIQVRDLADRLRVTDKRERRNQCTGAHPGHGVELGLGEWVLTRDLLPPFEKSRPKCSPVAPTRYDQDVDHRRLFLPARIVQVVLGLRALEQLTKQSASTCGVPLIATLRSLRRSCCEI